MQREYHKVYSSEAKLNKFKEEMKKMYKNKVNACTEEYTFVDLLSSKLEQLITDAVKQQLPTKVAKDVVLFINRKYNLIKLILMDLATKEEFDSYTSYIYFARTFAEDWLTMYSNNYIFERIENNATRYEKHAETVITSIIEAVKTNVLRARDSKSIEEWLSISLEDVGVTLPVTDVRNLVQFDIESFENLNRLFVGMLSEMGGQILDIFRTETALSVQWKGHSPYIQVIEDLWSCGAQCPFCKEPCQCDKEHTGHDHRSIQHRPIGASGWRRISNQKMLIENCSYNIQTLSIFRCLCSPRCTMGPVMRDDKVSHPHREYKKYFPNWSIAPSPNMDSPVYWMWFMATFESQLVEYHDCEAIDSLSEYYG